MSRIKREAKTIGIMISLYCRNHHHSTGLCDDCSKLNEYAQSRLEKCKYGETKPNCNHCPIHCYRKDYRDEIKKVMRYSGPKMLFRHPYLAIMHLADRFFNKNANIE